MSGVQLAAEAKANAALIIQAVNERDALVAVAENNEELEKLASITVEYHGTSEALKAARKIQSIVTANRNNLAALRGESDRSICKNCGASFVGHGSLKNTCPSCGESEGGK